MQRPRVVVEGRHVWVDAYARADGTFVEGYCGAVTS
jgi:hypothetical protein